MNKEHVMLLFTFILLAAAISMVFIMRFTSPKVAAEEGVLVSSKAVYIMNPVTETED